MTEWLKGLNPSVAGYVSVAAIGVLALIVFRIARRIVMLGYFILYFFFGFGIVYTASAYSTRSIQVPLAMPIVGGLAFAMAASFVRAKLMRIVAVIMLVALFSLAGKFWSEYTSAHKPGGDQSAMEENQRLAAQGLRAVKSEFESIQQYLPRKDGQIAPGWISPETLKRARIDLHLQKVDEKPDWHTWLTGLYKQETEDLGIWTSGGTAELAKKSLQLRAK
ncbi:MAG: hypothetical protein ACHQ50_06280 [Fimbriimonadales bacterium]